ncbi:prolyl 4-hydroxylase subunit alpha-2 isoform X1 [Drosophila santomea]|uniref:prolyl 4-hydroxylase subunit alpha-2 isoform X1 n=2 Tax=Drosophila santomea TaxID=129105 RepID=UPI0019543502|nr:prolyl 4-hydroxylase subunit alpha-2 isoform X1 [Drosophila santomea]
MPKLLTSLAILYLLVLVKSHGKTKVLRNNYAISIHDMVKLIDYEHYLLDILQNFTNALQQRVDTIEYYLYTTDYEAEKKLPDDPIKSFRIIRRLHSDYLNWMWFMEQQPWETLVKQIIAIAPQMPTLKDIEEAINGFRLIQWTYSLPTAQMAEGVLQNIHHNTSLDAMQCLTIARHLVKHKEFIRAREWLMVGLQMHEADEDNEDFYSQLGMPLADFYELFVEIHDELGSRYLAMSELRLAIKKWPERVSLQRALSRLKVNIRIGKEQAKAKEKSQGVYKKCCNTECRPTAKLHCLYNTTSSYFLRLAPLKMELLSLDPYMVLFHDVASDKDIISIRNLANGGLVRAVTVTKDGSYEEDPARTTKGTWLVGNSKLIQRLSRLTQDMTNLDIRDADPFQVLNYGIGGYYGTHFDFIADTEMGNFSNRIATAVFYLSDVPQGGATIFPKLGLSVFPKKGSALLWYNLDHKGDGDNRTAHSACPTIVGSRWVMTKWINEREQLFRRPCLTTL